MALCLCRNFTCVQVGAEECSHDQEAKCDSSHTWPAIPQRGRGNHVTAMTLGFQRHHISWFRIKAEQWLQICVLFFLPTYSKRMRARARRCLFLLQTFEVLGSDSPGVCTFVYRLKQTVEISPHHVMYPQVQLTMTLGICYVTGNIRKEGGC